MTLLIELMIHDQVSGYVSSIIYDLFTSNGSVVMVNDLGKCVDLRHPVCRQSELPVFPSPP